MKSNEMLSENDIKQLFLKTIKNEKNKEEIVKKFITKSKKYKNTRYIIYGAIVQKEYYRGKGKLQITINNSGFNCNLKSNFYDGKVKFGHIGNLYHKYINMFYIKDVQYAITWNGHIYELKEEKDKIIVTLNINTMLEWLREILLQKELINRKDVINCNFIKLIESGLIFDEALKIQREMLSC